MSLFRNPRIREVEGNVVYVQFKPDKMPANIYFSRLREAVRLAAATIEMATGVPLL